MPNINDAFPSKYLKTSDLNGMEPIVTIDRIEWEPVGRDREMKAVLYFAGKKKAIVLNKTMARKVAELAGTPLTEQWHGVQVKLYASEATFGDDVYDVVRIKAATNGQPKPAPPPAPPSRATGEFDDSDIPF